LFFTWEEYDFSLRAIALQWSIRYAGSLAVIHKVSPQARVRWNSERMRLFVRNRLIIARKWHVSWVRLLPRIGGYLLKAARNGRLLPALSGVFEAIVVDRALFKRTMAPHMRLYLRENESRFHGNFIRSFYRHVVLEMQPDPK
jgi:GT2 family glycosyltransferase